MLRNEAHTAWERLENIALSGRGVVQNERFRHGRRSDHTGFDEIALN